MPGMVVCAEPPAAQVGANILAAGGNAVDAAIAAGFAEGASNPIMSGIGGSGTMVLHLAATGQQIALDFWGVCGSGIDLAAYAQSYLGQDGACTRYHVRGRTSEIGYKASLVPGFVRGVHLAWRRFGSGRLAWAELLEPSIRLARDGFDVYPYVYRSWQSGVGFAGQDIHARIMACPAAAAIYTRNGHPWKVGERVVQADLANTLERIAREGPDVFYVGEIGDVIARDFETHGGHIRKPDLEAYAPVFNPPVRGKYRDFEIVSDSAPGSGALIVESLQAAEAFGIGALEWGSPEYIDRLGRIFTLVFSDRARYMGDPRFVDVPMDAFTSLARAAEIAERVRTDADLDEPVWYPVGSTGTTHVSVMDADGNAVGMTHTLGTSSGIVTPGLGFLYNNDVNAFDPLPGHPNSIQPGKRAVNGGGPTILLRDGQPTMVIGSPAGARKVTAIAQALLSVYDYGMGVQGAVSAPRFHAEDQRRSIVLEPMYPQSTAAALERLGSTVQRDSLGARLSAIARDPATGALEGGTDPRGGAGLAEIE
jgi:gamma-glutamyltranspeptidase/glutathione hydrolase